MVCEDWPAGRPILQQNYHSFWRYEKLFIIVSRSESFLQSPSSSLMVSMESMEIPVYRRASPQNTVINSHPSFTSLARWRRGIARRGGGPGPPAAWAEAAASTTHTSNYGLFSPRLFLCNDSNNDRYLMFGLTGDCLFHYQPIFLFARRSTGSEFSAEYCSSLTASSPNLWPRGDGWETLGPRCPGWGTGGTVYGPGVASEWPSGGHYV